MLIVFSGFKNLFSIFFYIVRYTPYYVKRVECLEKRYINVTNYLFYLKNIIIELRRTSVF